MRGSNLGTSSISKRLRRRGRWAPQKAARTGEQLFLVRAAFVLGTPATLHDAHDACATGGVLLGPCHYWTAGQESHRIARLAGFQIATYGRPYRKEAITIGDQ